MRGPISVLLALAACAALLAAACDGGGAPPTDLPPEPPETDEPQNTPPTATIRAPSDGASYTAPADVEFRGSASDAEDGALAGADLVWTSSLDGGIGTDSAFTRPDLSVGTHRITLEATDADGATGADSLSITIRANRAPEASISSPADGAEFTEGDTVAFAGTAEDPEDGALADSALAWSSDVDGAIGAGASIAYAGLSVATHRITLSATDSHGATAADTVSITIIEGPSPPAAPSDLEATALSPDSVRLTWTDESDDEEAFEVEQSCCGIDFTVIGTTPANATAVVVTGLDPGTLQRFRIRAVNAEGKSDYSNVAEVITPAYEPVTAYATADNVVIFSTVDDSHANTVYPAGTIYVGCLYDNGAFVDNFACYETLLQFSGIVPHIDGKPIERATLVLWVVQPPGDHAVTYFATAPAEPWDPATVTWNTAPPVYEAEGQGPPTTAAVPYTFDVTGFVRAWETGELPNYGLMLKTSVLPSFPASSLIQVSEFESSDTYSAAGRRPHLYVEFADGGATPSAASTGTITLVMPER